MSNENQNAKAVFLHDFLFLSRPLSACPEAILNTYLSLVFDADVMALIALGASECADSRSQERKHVLQPWNHVDQGGEGLTLEKQKKEKDEQRPPKQNQIHHD